MAIPGIDRLEDDFKLLVAAAASGDRCPQTNPHGPIHSGSITALFEAGRIRSEVYRHNWRVVVILEGEHKGARTAPSSAGGSPYRVNGVHVDRLRGRVA